MLANASQAYGHSNGMPTRIKPSLPPGISAAPIPIRPPPTRQRPTLPALGTLGLNPAVQPPSTAPTISATNSSDSRIASKVLPRASAPSVSVYVQPPTVKKAIRNATPLIVVATCGDQM